MKTQTKVVSYMNLDTFKKELQKSLDEITNNDFNVVKDIKLSTTYLNFVIDTGHDSKNCILYTALIIFESK